MAKQSEAAGTLPLEGVRVLDFTALGMGPAAAMWLGDFGADVIKIENVGVGDRVRKQRQLMTSTQVAPPLGEDSPGFMALNRNKRSIALDLKDSRAKGVVFKLVRTADVVLSTYRPGVMDRLGFSYEKLRSINPRIIYATASGFGKSGPYAHKKGQDVVAQAMSGLMSMTGDRDSLPTAAGTYLIDYAAGMLIVIGVMAALLARVQTGQGQEVDTSLIDAGLALALMEGTSYLNTGFQWTRGGRGSAHAPGSATYAVYRTPDMPIIVNGNLAPVCEVLGIENLEADERFNTPEKRCLRQDEIRSILEKVLLTRPASEWVQRFDAKGVWAGPVYTYREVFADPQVLHNGLVMEVEHPLAGRFKTIGVPLRLYGTPPTLRRPPPLHGQHTEELLKELGYTTQEIRDLRSSKVAK